MKTTRIVLLTTLLTAMVYVAGQALAGVPNVELVTFLSFASGYLVGPGLGAVVGACGMAAHSLFNVMGAVPPPVWIAQIACYALIGATGGWLGPAIAGIRKRLAASTTAALTGSLLTLVYQLVVNVVSFAVFTSGVSLWAFVAGGIAFASIQFVWNAALFFAALPPTLRVLTRLRDEVAPAP
jgi:hypothetical protein